MFAQEVLSEIDLTIDKLILNAKEMTDQSTKEKINYLQNNQELLIEHFIQEDIKYKNKRNEIKKPNINSAALNINKKLRKLKNLNSEYTENTNDSFKLLYCEKKKNKSSIKTRKRRSFINLKINKR